MQLSTKSLSDQHPNPFSSSSSSSFSFFSILIDQRERVRERLQSSKTCHLMASTMKLSSDNMMNALLLLSFTVFFCSSLHQHPSMASAFEFQVGDPNGWVVPPANDSKIYNDWASENRFKIGDTVRFKYRKDSVMEVEEGDYKRCNSTHPISFSNTGNTVFKLDRSGAFYFISGVADHCQRGQRMIVKVMTSDHSYTAGRASSAALSFGSPEPVVLHLVMLMSCALASYYDLF
ncbi:early nodulin-like protein 6 [Malania oleifera]|uniref:early nodulin-like protein 6 n=1 Tax=Malania oleifera TaxID=397392 RepID=UPI0025AEA16C|nr:early nodulin-like protein 6 [Malania oleifera]